MTRDIDSVDPRQGDLARVQPDPAPRWPERTPPLSRELRSIGERGYIYQVSEAERETLYDIGRFRTVAVEDLVRHRYHGERDELGRDLRALALQGLIHRRTISTRGGKQLSVVVLTKRGKELVKGQTSGSVEQGLYSGFVKPAEVHHDAAIYRMYHAEAQKIENGGGRIRRVVLDYELKRNVYAPLAKARALPPLEYTRRQAEIATENDLKVVRGKILLPDLRIEYQSRDGERTHVDLELATHHYRRSQMRGKAEAGFKMYAPEDSISGLTSPFDPELTAGIFSF